MNDAHVSPTALPAAWRERADFLQRYGDPNSARLWLMAAAELERALEAHGAETLTLAEAAAISGYTAGYLGELIAAGRLHNAGRRNAPRVRRSDVPIKSPNSPGRPPGPSKGKGDGGGKVTKLLRQRRRT